MAFSPSASFVIRTDSSATGVAFIIDRMASMFSTTTSASWWIAWKRS